MDELLTELAQNQFDIPVIKLDGTLVRFNRDSKKNGWFVGFENIAKNGDTYIVARYGDWKTGEKYEYKQGKKGMSKQDQSLLARKLSECKRNFERERQEVQESVCAQAKNLWDSAGENARVPYLTGKQISSLYGCRSQLGANGRELLVPCRDSSGKLWGIQTIYPDGSKLFLAGQRNKGCFHTVHDSGVDLSTLADIWICEGFATAASIREATGDPAICTFNASNLIEVASELYSINPTANFWICGDEDYLTEVDGEKKNTGRIWAEKAANKVSGKAIYPVFQSKESEPTDFNDLHILEGIETVKQQLLGLEEPEKMYIMALGFDASRYYYTSSDNKHIKSLSESSHNKQHFLGLMPLRYWESCYPGGQEGTVSWDNAATDLMEKCRRKGPFNANNVRSTGAWLTPDKQLVLNRGDSLLLANKTVSFHGDKSKFIYEPGDLILPEPGQDFLSDSQCQEFLETLNMLKWAHKDYFKFLAGWLMISPICGALQWRPHLWLSGPSGSGKSTIMSEVVGKVLEKHGLFYQGQTTEAGIRQSLGKKALPVVFDEFETNDEKSGSRVGAVVELFRQASFETDAYIVKGSADGHSVGYLPRFQGLVSAINVNLPFEADKNRFTIIELLRPDGSPAESAAQFRHIQSRFQLINDEWVHGFYSRIFRLHDVFTHNHKMIFDVIADRYNARFAQQYGALLAGYSLCFGSNKIEMAQAEWFVQDTDLEFKKGEQNESEENECLSHIMARKVKLNGSINRDVSVSDIVVGSTRDANNYNESASKEDWKKALNLYGMKVDDGFLYVPNNHPELNSLFKGTKWSGIYDRSLKRIDGADNNGNKPVWISGGARKCTRIPLNAVIHYPLT